MGRLTLVTGGVRSGKSAWALEQVNRSLSPEKVFIATAEAFDDEMHLRINNHRKERGAEWTTKETPLELAAVVQSLSTDAVAVIDCCTVWLGNIWHAASGSEETMGKAIDELHEELVLWQKRSRGLLYVVTNEVGWGIVPHDPEVRRYRDAIGNLNQRIARIADEVYLCVAGIAVAIKQSSQGARP